MSSPFSRLLARKRVALWRPMPADAIVYWREFLRVNFDKLLLLTLIVLLYKWGVDQKILAGAVGALVALIQAQRYERRNREK